MACVLLFQARKMVIGMSFHNDSTFFLALTKSFVMIDDRKLRSICSSLSSILSEKLLSSC